MRYTESLTMEAIQTLAPSAFAGQAFEKQSDRYAFIPTSSIIAEMINSGFAPVAASQSSSRIPGKEFFTKHMIRFRDQRSLESPAIVGNSILEAVLINSHDGTSLYQLILGLFRYTCENGMMVSDGTFQSVRIRHLGNVVQQVIDGSKRLFSEGQKVLDVVGKWQGIELTETEQLALATSAHALRFPEGSQVEPKSLLAARRYEDNGADLWHTFNRIQENTTRGFGKRERDANRRRISVTRGVRAVTSISENTKLNQGLWTLASGLAELKAAA